MTTVLALVASVQDLADLQAGFTDQADLAIVGLDGGAVGVFTGSETLADELFAAEQTIAVADDAAISSLGPALDGLTIDPTQIFGVLTTLFGDGRESVLDTDAQSTLAGYLLTFSAAAQATLAAADSTAEETTGPCRPPRT